MLALKIIWGIIAGWAIALWIFLAWWGTAALKSGLSPSPMAIILIMVFIAIYLGSGFLSCTIAELKGRNRMAHFFGGLALPVFYPSFIIFLPSKVGDIVIQVREETEEKELESLSERLTMKLKSRMKDAALTTSQIFRLSMGKDGKVNAVSEIELQAAQMETIMRSREGKDNQEKVRIGPPKKEPEADTESDMSTTAGANAFDGMSTEPGIDSESGQNPEDDENATPEEPQFNQEYFSLIARDESGDYLGPFILETDDGRIIEVCKIIKCLPEVIAIEIIDKNDNIRKIRMPYSKVKGCWLKEDYLDNNQ